MTHTQSIRILPLLAIVGLLLSQTACTNSVTTDLNLVLTTTSAVVDITLPQYAAQLNPYFTDVTTFVDKVTVELATSDSPAQKAAVIAQDAAAIAAPNLSGVPAEIVTRITAIAPLIANLVNELQGLSSLIDNTPGGANAFFAAHKAVKSPSAKDLANIRAKNATLKAKLVGSKKP